MIGHSSTTPKPLNLFCQVLVCVLVLTAAANAYEKFHRHGNESSPKLNYDSLFAAASPLDTSPEGRQVIEKCLDAYGGLQLLEKLTSVKLHWRMSALMSSDSVDVVKTMAAGRRYKIERKGSRGSELRMIDGNRAWFQNADTSIELNSGRYKAELFSYLVLSMPLALKTERFDDIRYGGRVDDPLHYLYLDKEDSLMVVLGIDPDNYMIKKVEGLIRQEDASFVFVNHFDDFREHHGYLFPHSLINVSMGLTVGQSVLKDIEVNVDIEETYFSLPEPIGD